MSSVPTKDPQELAESREENREQGIDWRGVALAAVVTMAALFGLQEWYRTFNLVNQPDYSAAEIGVQLTALRAAQTEALQSGTMPIDRAMRMMIERGRTASALITPEPSTDPAPAAGWMHHPAYEAPPTLDVPPEELIPQEELAPGTDVEPTEAEQPAAPGGETAAQPTPGVQQAPRPAGGQPAGAAAQPRAPQQEATGAAARPRAPQQEPAAGAAQPRTPQQEAAGAAAQPPTKRAPAPEPGAAQPQQPPTKRAPTPPPAQPAPAQ